MKVMVGSTALARHIDGVTPKDVDYFSDEPIEGTDVFWHPSLEGYEWSGEVASLDELYTIKVSHSFWELPNGSWDKHMFHLVKMQQAGAKFLPDLYEVLYPIWEQRYGAKKVNLEADPDEFFNKQVTRIYEHDTIHASIAFYDEPLFNRILRDGHDVAVSQSKFEALPNADKIMLVQEEVFATALERKVIPGLLPWKHAYMWALRKLITSFSKGWFPLWAVLHFDELRTPPFNYHDVMLTNQHKLVPLKEGSMA